MNGPSASNPYAWEEIGQKSTETSANDNYYFWLSVSKMMHEVIFTTGGLLLALLLYLVMTKAKKSMKNYKKMLLFCCFADIQYLIISHFIQLIIKTQQSVELCVMGGMARHLSYGGQVLAMAVYAAAFGITMTSLPVNYFYRYLCAAGIPPSNKRVFSMYMIGYAAVIPLSVLAWLSFQFGGIGRPGFNFGSLWFKTSPLPKILIVDFKSTLTKVMLTYLTNSVAGCYLLSLYWARRTVKLMGLRIQSTVVSRINRQVALALLAQAILPIFVSVGPNAVLISAIVFEMDPGVLAMMMFNSIALMPVLNSLSTIMIIRPFRQALTKALQRVAKEISSVF